MPEPRKLYQSIKHFGLGNACEEQFTNESDCGNKIHA